MTYCNRCLFLKVALLREIEPLGIMGIADGEINNN